MPATFLRRLAALLPLLCLAALTACGGGAAEQAPGQPLSTPGTKDDDNAFAAVPRGTLLQSPWSAYPRLVRLSHQAEAARNGRIVASVTEIDGPDRRAGFHASDDGGRSFRRLGTLRDDAFSRGLCCGSLFELPSPVGALPAGTLLYAASVGQDVPGLPMAHPIFRSDDGGASFQRLHGAECGRAGVPRQSEGTGVWEPEFFVAGDGSLACVFSDETVPGHSQVLRMVVTTDGATWSTPRTIVAGTSPSDRPGMATVRRMPDGRYAMSFESCSTTRLDCAARLRLSPDGLDWGPADAPALPARSAAGQFFRHAPTLAWSPSPGHPAGVLLLIGQLLVGQDGAADPASGRAMMVSDSGDPAGPWRLAAAPIGLQRPPLQGNFCQNYSTALLPSADGSDLLAMQTDLSAPGRCQARFAASPWGR